MKTPYPFIYICSLLRTGSTVLQEALTFERASYIFHEPMWGANEFQNEAIAYNEFETWGIKVKKLFSPQQSLAEFLWKLYQHVPQLGVKEVRNFGWQIYPNILNDVRFILTGRDPRDIYISCHYYLQRSKAWTPRFQPFSPEGLYKEVEPDMLRQFEIANTQEHVKKVKYEEFCADTGVLEDIKQFVKSSWATGNIGGFHKQIERGQHEVELHQGKITDNAVGHWQGEKDQNVLDNANKFYELMKDYREFWEY